MNRTTHLKGARLATTLILLLSAGTAQAEWQALIGDDLDGWGRQGGSAGYRVKDGTVIGVSVDNSPNTFLVTDETYSDFILEYDVWGARDLNSGVQIRSHVDDEGVVYGLQVELDPTVRAFSGGLYDEERRKWLYPLSLNEKGQQAYRTGYWNRFRVEAIGDSIRVWVNGVMTANLRDELDSAGFIGLQVHSIKQPEHAGREVRWRNLRILTENLEANRTPPDPDVTEVSFLVNRLTDYEKRRGWRLLWDGQSTAGWRGAKLDRFPDSGWAIEDGVLTVLATDGGESSGPGDIVTLDSFSDFELQLEFLLTEGANSGIKYFVDPDLNLGPGSAIGCEFQILDDALHPDAKLGVLGNRTLGALYDLIAPESYSAPGRAKQFKGIGEWNQSRIVSRNGRVEHWLNGEKVVEYDRFSQMFRALVNYSKYQQWENFGQWPEGRILLQDHGDTVSFRSIKVREF
ncbi:MAG: 3-keto-disaccharide hydrolase [Lysobacterales bacterium]